MITSGALRTQAVQGDRDAQFRLGYRLMFSRNRERQKPKEAITWWHLAAAKSHTRAQFYLGVSFDRGLGVEKNLKKAMFFYNKAAKKGHPEAQYNLALGY